MCDLGWEFATHEMVVDPSRKHRCLHTCHARFRKCRYPSVQFLPARLQQPFLKNGAIRLAHTVADRLFVYVKSSVVHVHQLPRTHATRGSTVIPSLRSDPEARST